MADDLFGIKNEINELDFWSNNLEKIAEILTEKINQIGNKK